MTDVLKIALERRAELHEEVAKLDEFIRMAESLMRGSNDKPEEKKATPEPTVDADETAQPRPNLLRRGPTVING
ncbi:MAG: hypothetical protein AAFV19_17020 [Pseudomonadota bacterium]